MVSKSLILCFVVASICQFSQARTFRHTAIKTISDGICPDESDVPTYLADPDNCAGFYECSNGVPYHFLCAPGDYFDDVDLICKNYLDVNCGTRPTTSSTVSTTSTATTITEPPTTPSITS